MLTLLILLSGKVVDENALESLYEEMKNMGNPFLEYVARRNKEEGKTETLDKVFREMEAEGADPDFIRRIVEKVSQGMPSEA